MHFRHVGIRVNKLSPELLSFYGRAGFTPTASGKEIIAGYAYNWVKLTNESGLVIELIDNGHSHLAFTVDELDPEAYVFISPDGFKLQFTQDPGGAPVELVKEEK